VYYQNSYFKEWGDDQAGDLRDTIYLDALRFLEARNCKGLLLDIGTSSGRLLSIARGRGWEVEGQDISQESCRTAKELYDLDIFSYDLKDMEWESEHYDAITMVNVLDHLPDPWWVLENAFKALKKKGLIYVRIPNGNLHSLLYRIADAMPIAFLKTKLNKLLVMHLYHLNHQFITRLLHAKGFRCVLINNSKSSKVSTYKAFDKLDNLCLLILKKTYPAITNIAYKISKGRIILSPSINIYAVKP
jgi:2-polyprenyl-3-methyl-5-hydroxy-6-metoxy-1,4-benzoquinol methylase